MTLLSRVAAAGRRVQDRLARVWFSSLPFRVVALILGGSVLVLLLGGFVLVGQATEGILEGKKQSSVTEASAALDRIQTQLRATDLHSASLYERLSQLADEAGSQPDQYSIVVQGPVSRFVSPGITADSVPPALAAQVEKGEGLWVTSTKVVYDDPGRASVPGLAIGATLESPQGTERFPIYFIFPETHELATLAVLRSAVASTGALLLVSLAGIAWVVSREVVTPVREASVAASRIASGRFDERMKVRGTDDLASLATSMNDMAAELSHKIAQLEDLGHVQRRFVSDVSHELRTPLTTVRMAADMIYDGRDEMEPFAARSAELMHEELDRFESLLADLLEISRLDAGAAVLSLEEGDLAELVMAEMTAEKPLADQMGVEMRLRSLGPAMVEMDARRITRIVRNLLTNAIEHGEGRPVELAVASNESAVALRVRDHGVGFLPEQAEQVFGRFWRADPSRQRTVGGTGLGLAISLEDAALHQGTLTAWGRPGQGACFLLVLPRVGGGTVRTSPLHLPEEEA